MILFAGEGAGAAGHCVQPTAARLHGRSDHRQPGEGGATARLPNTGAGPGADHLRGLLPLPYPVPHAPRGKIS